MVIEKADHTQIIKTLKKLNANKNSKYPILSIYLGTEDKKSPTTDFLLSKFHSEILQKMKEEEKKLFKESLMKIEEYLKDLFDTRGNRSIAFFTVDNQLFEALDFEFPLSSFYAISDSPDIKPILKALKIHQKYLVLLVDREKARLFTVHLGEIEEHKDIFDESVPQKVKAINEAWGRESKILRHIEDHLHRHLKLIVHETIKFIDTKNIHFIILGGHKDIFEKMKKHLPKSISQKILGTFVTELNIPINDVFLKSKKIAKNFI